MHLRALRSAVSRAVVPHFDRLGFRRQRHYLKFAAGFRDLKSFLCNLFGPFTRLTDVGVFTFFLAVVAWLQWQTLEKTDRTKLNSGLG
jgi:hypothetical protein